ncbi:hypothetical protein C7N43_04940 [Sphingobacteriales bacterium UPWRP_1]|nr:hypothetical protein BVG80_06865 [Sphingobacteriales bacterium TSM_CSM]PSJ78169.1 hypothetical protein C7N43_04940 [Sphingobacteriales bacterium UPWRP_1]
MPFSAGLKLGKWWRNKILPLSGIVFYCAAFAGVMLPLCPAILNLLLFLISATGVGAYGYFMNDWFDIEQDVKSGKNNISLQFGKYGKMLMVITLLTAGWLPWFYLPSNPTNIFLLAVQCVLLALYAMPPFRLKERGVLAWFTDSAYAFVLPALITLATFSQLFATQWPARVEIITSLFMLWALLYGLRSIIEHQIQDFDNDRIAGINTWVTKNGTGDARKITSRLLPAEIALFALLLLVMSPWLLFFCAIMLFNYLSGRNRFNPADLRKSMMQPHTFLSTLYDTIFPVSMFLLFILLVMGMPLPLLIMPVLVADFHRFRVHRDFGILFTCLFAAVYIPYLVNTVLPPWWVTVAVVTAAMGWQCIYDLFLPAKAKPMKNILLTTFVLCLLTGCVLFYLFLNARFWQQYTATSFGEHIALFAAVWGWLGCWGFREVWYIQLCKCYPQLETNPPQNMFLPVVASRIALPAEMLLFIFVCSLAYKFSESIVLPVFAAVSGLKIIYLLYAHAIPAHTAHNVRVITSSLNPFNLNPLRNVQIFGFVFMSQFYNKWLPIIIFAEIFASLKLNNYLWTLILPLLINALSDVMFSVNLITYSKNERH